MARRRRIVAAGALVVSLAACSGNERVAVEEAAPTPPVAASSSDAQPTPAATEELLYRAEVEELVVDAVSEEVGIPRFLVSRYIDRNGGFEEMARRFGVTDEQLARLDEGGTRTEVDAVLEPVVEEIRARVGQERRA